MDDVRDHEQVQEDQCERAPPAGLRFTYAGFTVAREGDRGTGSSRNRSSSFQFLADATTFHRVGEFTSKRAVRYRADYGCDPRGRNMTPRIKRACEPELSLTPAFRPVSS